MYAKKENIYLAHVSEHNSNHKKQVFILMIYYGKGWHYLAVKKLSALLRGITVNFIAWIVFITIEQKNLNDRKIMWK